MAREFTRNMFIMLITIMIGTVVITYFIGDIVSRSRIETLTIEHQTEISDVKSRNENFTDHFLQGSVTLDSAREIRELGNYYFDFALYWYNTAIATQNLNLTTKCIKNCTLAMENYLASSSKFNQSQPLFTHAKNYTDKTKYITALDYYITFAQLGENITLLRYQASIYLKQAAENLSFGNLINATALIQLLNQTEQLYLGAVSDYNTIKDQIDGYLFFTEIREQEPS